MTDFTYINLDTYERLKHYQYFKSLAYPYVGVTVQVNITNFYRWCKDNQQPFFLSLLWCVAQAANEIKEFRQRILGDQIIEYTYCGTSHTVAKEDGTFAYCALDSQESFTDFLQIGAKATAKVKIQGGIEEDEEVSMSRLFISCLPTLSYTSLVQPTPMPSDSNPRITWGKFYSNGQDMLMPLSVLCHHGLVDGRHIGNFYEALDRKMEEISKSGELATP